MSMTLSGNGTITGLVSGGLPDGTVLPADLSTGGPYWDTSGNLGIGVTPSAWTQYKVIQLYPSASCYLAGYGNEFQIGTSAYFDGSWRYQYTGIPISKYSQASGAHAWYTAPSGTAGNAITFTQAMTLDSSGNLLVGTTTSPSATISGTLIQNPIIGANRSSAGTVTTTVYHWAFYNGNGLVGSITTNGSSTTYTTSSDYRLKEDYQPVADAIVRLNQLKPVNFAWKVDGSRCDGFLAHELQEVIPEAATGTKDEMRTEEYEVTPAINDEEGNVITEAVMGEREVPVYQGIDQSKIVPLLTAALQELIQEVADLKAEVASLKGEQ